MPSTGKDLPWAVLAQSTERRIQGYTAKVRLEPIVKELLTSEKCIYIKDCLSNSEVIHLVRSFPDKNTLIRSYPLEIPLDEWHNLNMR
jgi:hypothetical protein